MLKLHFAPNSRAGRIVWLLEELGLPYDINKMAFHPQDLKSDEHRSRHPLGRVPVLEDGEISIYESGAIVEYIIDEKISQGHAKILVGLENAQLLAEKIISKKLSVRQAEALIRITKGNKSMNKRSKDSNIIDIENQLMEKIGMRVYVNNKKNNSGTIAFEYKGLDQMERLIQIIKSNY